ncbi:uncharacterized protein LOC111021896 [Momordica charantia]|uniref:Uncharacterized protein LOC111021896 n=1 Tax=Momordica charantia TaxID=3673 RepID=A0A6J1DL14_MOMCH|nr:uncharacterized protein LOC111021896 [Momordica charantia]
MASTSAVSVAMPITKASARSSQRFGRARALPLRPSSSSNPTPTPTPTAAPASNSAAKFQVRASLKDKAVAGLAVTALTASLLIPEVAEAAGPGVTPSLQNFLLSIAAGGVVVTAIIGAVFGVANFDPVKRT